MACYPQINVSGLYSLVEKDNIMPHAVCYYHIVWATKHRQAIITTEIEALLIRVMCDKSSELRCAIHAINTAYDHIHIAVSIRLSISVAEWVRQMKSLSSLRVRQEMDNEFRWQGSYSVHTFGRKALPFVVSYIEKQKQHHQDNTTEAYLEYIPEEK